MYDCSEHAVVMYEVPNYTALLQNLEFEKMKNKLTAFYGNRTLISALHNFKTGPYNERSKCAQS